MKFGGVTVGTHTYKQYNIQVARGNGCFHEIIRIIKLFDWPKRSPKVKSVMAQYLKIYFLMYTNYVQSFMLLSHSAQLLLNFCYAAPLQVFIMLYIEDFHIHHYIGFPQIESHISDACYNFKMTV